MAEKTKPSFEVAMEGSRMIATEFEICLVCGADVLSMYDSEEIAMCQTHSNTDKLQALFKLERRIKLTREQIESRQDDV